ncbi:cobalamin-dependent protein [Methylobacterium persicinum]
MELQGGDGDPGAKAAAPPLGLITLAAMLPETWQIGLLNANCEPLTDEAIRGVDLVMTGGMLPQEPDCLEIIERCRTLGTPVCVGGPAPTSTPEVYDRADFVVAGEAEESFPNSSPPGSGASGRVVSPPSSSRRTSRRARFPGSTC